MKHGFSILDADLHVIEPYDLYLKYMDPKWGDSIPRAEPRKLNVGELHDFKTADGSPARKPWLEAPPKAALTASSRRINQRKEQIAPYYTEAVEQQFDPVSQLKAMDREGIDIAVLFRTFPLHADESQQPEYANALCQVWNDWITDFCNGNPRRMKATGLITLHDVNLAVAEARRVVKELGHVGLCMIPQPVNGRHVQDDYFDPLWTAIEELGVPGGSFPTSLNSSDFQAFEARLPRT